MMTSFGLGNRYEFLTCLLMLNVAAPTKAIIAAKNPDAVNFGDSKDAKPINDTNGKLYFNTQLKCICLTF